MKRFVVVRARGEKYAHLAGLADRVAGVLRAQGHKVEMKRRNGKYDLAIAIGGDGTVMHAISEFSPRGIPTIGLNGGSVGFLTSAEQSMWENFAERVGNGEYDVERRVALEFSHDGHTFGPFVNDVVLKHSKVGTFSIRLNGEQLFESIQADGLVVSTQTGSTAYNIAAHGPIVLSGSTVAILTFLAPTHINMRPVVFDHLTHGGVLEVTLTESKEDLPVSLAADGKSFGRREGFVRAGLRVGDSIEIRASKTPILFATFGFSAQIEALKKKKGLAQ